MHIHATDRRQSRGFAPAYQFRRTPQNGRPGTDRHQTTHRFTVKSAGAGRIDGASESIRLEQISALKKRQFSRGKTIALVGGLLGGASLGLFIYGFAEYAGAFALR
jgi:hypothetical protein